MRKWDGPPLAREVGVVVPVHDEEETLDASLGALGSAVGSVTASATPVTVVVVLDDCSDRSEPIARAWAAAGGGHPLESRVVSLIAARNVGRARAAGVAALRADRSPVRWRSLGKRLHRPAPAWLVTTDADSQVPPDWLTHQLALWRSGVTVWSGGVDVADWSDRDSRLAGRWRRLYEGEPDAVHGASLGFSPSAYDVCGGFQWRATGEDRALVRAATANGAVVHHCRCVPVLTSARRHARAPLGFAHALTRLEHG